MKKTLVIIVLLLAIGAYFLFFNDSGESNLRNETNFAIDDVSEIDRIQMKDRTGDKVNLVKKGDIWMVNDKYPAFGPTVDYFLNETLAKIRIKGPVQKAARENVIRMMVAHSTHVQIYSDGKIIRDYYVGVPNQRQTGTFIHINGLNTPYLAHILGFGGIIDPRFSVLEKEWFDKTVFDYEPEEIESIEIKNNAIPDESFVLSRSEDKFKISPTVGKLSQSAARSYFALFKFKNFEGYADYLTQHVKDSLKQATPYLSITVTSKDGKKNTLNLHQKGGQGNTLYDRKGHVLVEDTERYFAMFTDFEYLVTVQNYVFGKLIVKRSFFGK